jgi:hypothetical protein
MPRSVAPSLARELRAALAPFGVEVGRLRRPPAGLGRATLLAGPVVVKLAPREAGDELVQRLRVLRALRPRAVAVPRPLADEPFVLSVGLGWAYRALPGRTARACALDGSREAFGVLAGRLDAALARTPARAPVAAPDLAALAAAERLQQLVVVPLGFDQPYHARRCAALGLARVVAPEQRTPAAIRDAVRGVLDDAGMAERARAFADEMAAMPDARAAVRRLERLVA